jgi:hypothetical protein
MKEVYKTVKGVTYFPSYRYAVGYAIDNGYLHILVKKY